jgi:hypothetical protein
MRSTKRLWATTILVSLVMAMTLAWVGSASAAVIDPQGGVFEENCQGQCHGTIWGPTKMATEINFSHGYHAVYQCSSCHGTQFVHNQNGTIKPDMKLCWSCHGLNHGPQGEMATGKCDACHKTPVKKLRPANHTADWKGKPHAGPGATQLRTRCMMCHTGAFCTKCHDQKGITWQPSDGQWSYNSGDGCQQCHSLSTLRKAVGEVKAGVASPLEKSFQVMGIDSSAHRGLTCQQCHPDFSYVPTKNLTNVWAINSALSCQNCHSEDGAKTLAAYASNGTSPTVTMPKKAMVAGDYLKSVHGQLLIKGDIKTATCASCHGGHDIQKLDNETAKAAIHSSADKVCAGCHAKEYASYDDYYHGAAYKRGASDAPACWDCHGAHNVLKVKDPGSMVSASNRAKTCAVCHKDASASFAQQGGDLIHQKKSVYNDNVIVRLIATLRAMIPGNS